MLMRGVAPGDGRGDPRLADHAAVALVGARRERQMSEALASRDVIGQAKGMLMQRDGITGQRAFDLLIGASQHANLKLADVARWLVESHEHNAEQR